MTFNKDVKEVREWVSAASFPGEDVPGITNSKVLDQEWSSRKSSKLPVAGTEKTEKTVMRRDSKGEEGQIVYGMALYTNNWKWCTGKEHGRQ